MTYSRRARWRFRCRATAIAGFALLGSAAGWCAALAEHAASPESETAINAVSLVVGFTAPAPAGETPTA
jgi:hypothetical protein